MSEPLRLALSIVTLVLSIGSLGLSIWTLSFIRRVARTLELKEVELATRIDGDGEFRRAFEHQ